MVNARTSDPRFNVLILAEPNGLHRSFVGAADYWLKKLALDSNFTVQYVHNTDLITDDFLSQFQLFVQLNYPPYGWNEPAMAAFEKYIVLGKGGWIGFHPASLIGEFNGYQVWPWYMRFMGDIRWSNSITKCADGNVLVEDNRHICMQNVPEEFFVKKDEWYTYNRSPRAHVRVLASVDEFTYRPGSNIRMGDHPVVWTNERVKARNIYISMGHSASLFDNPAYTTLVRNSIFWAAEN